MGTHRGQTLQVNQILQLFTTLLVFTCFYSPCSADPAVKTNRFIAVSGGALAQDYTEFDAYQRTADGVFNRERGSLRSIELQARWQGYEWGEAQDPLQLLIQASLHRSWGNTRYTGYLQSGATLIPYKATTGNQIDKQTLRIGLAKKTADTFQLIPFLEYQRQNWNRRLVQYDETYIHQAALLGLMGQYQTEDSPWTIEAELAAGPMLQAKMKAPALSFDQNLGGRPVWQFGISTKYRLDERWHLSASARYTGWQYAASAVSNNLQEPASETRQATLLIGLQAQY